MATYIRLTDYKDSNSKEEGFFKPENRYEAKQDDFKKISGSPIGYWLSDKFRNIFLSKTIASEYEAGSGLSTSDNERFLRYIWEVEKGKTANKNTDELKWYLFHKGGEYRKWFGNLEHVVNWKNDGEEIKHWVVNNPKDPKTTHWSRRIFNTNLYFRKGLIWSVISSGKISFRYTDENAMISNAAGGIFSIQDIDNLSFLLAAINTNLWSKLFSTINPTINYSSGIVQNAPLPKKTDSIQLNIINSITQQNIDISKEEWDSRETSWDFTKNELLKHKTDSKLETAYANYCNHWREKFNTLHANEEELNRLFIDIYGLQDELTPAVELKDITILKQETDIVDGELVFNTDEIMKQFISYGVGVMFGRYSLDQEGLVVANLNQDYPRNTSFEIDDDNIIPVLEDEYFSDDIVSRFVNFVKVTFGEENLSKNIKFIEQSLSKDLRKYFVKDFYEDHIKRYKKRPIYWMVSSPKKGFMSLIYMHRYQGDIFARVRNSYLSEYIAKLEAHKETLTLTTSSSTASDKDKKDADKRIKEIETKLKELIAFDRDVMMSYAQNGVEIDLDDGVKVNYCKFQDIMYEIKGLYK